jgi:NAD-dependent deacetylase
MKKDALEAQIEKIADLIIQSGSIIVFTGAGISTESGIPDFRSPGGVWTKFDPREFTYQRFVGDIEVRRKAWQFFRAIPWTEVKPNRAHFAVVELEKMGKVDCIITQNIDGLHQMAGNTATRVIELHGTTRFVHCLKCGKRWPRDEIEQWLDQGIEVPMCDDCGGIMKSATISFGQSMPVEETREAEQRSRQCDLCIVIGSSLVVYPAAHMPVYAVQSGAKLVIINRDPTPLDSAASVVVNAGAGETMVKVLEIVKAKAASIRN